MSEVRKYYRNKIEQIQRKIQRRQNWLKSDKANKAGLLADYHRDVVKHEILQLKRDMAEAKRILKRYTKG